MKWRAPYGAANPAATGRGVGGPRGSTGAGAELAVFAGSTVAAAAALARPRGDGPGPYGRALAAYLDAVRTERGIIERGAVVCDTPRVQNVYVGPYARVDGATLVEASTLLS